MRRLITAVIAGLAGIAAAGWPATPLTRAAANPRSPTSAPQHGIARLGFSPIEPDAPEEDLSPTKPFTKGMATDGTAAAHPIGLPELLGLTLARNPRLARVGWTVETARGRALQAGLCPDPTFNILGDELSDRTGPGGIWTFRLSQEIMTGNKLQLSRAAGLMEVDQDTLAAITERYQVFTEVRQAFFEALMLQRQTEILTELVKLADQSVENTEKLVKAKEASPLDVVQLEVDRERFRADLESAQRSLPAAYRKLAASAGVQDMPLTSLAGDLEMPLPEYDLDRIRAYVLGVHPELQSAQLGVERAQLLLRRAEVERIPNITVNAGYTRQNENRSDDWDVGVGLPLPLWNRNQGNILAARAQVNEAIEQAGRVQNDLVNRLATAFGTYAGARQRAERYRKSIFPRAKETYQLSLRAYQGGQFEFLRVLQAQRAVAEANLEYLKSLGEMWRAASEVAGLMLEDDWPLAAAPAPGRKQP